MVVTVVVTGALIDQCIHCRPFYSPTNTTYTAKSFLFRVTKNSWYRRQRRPICNYTTLSNNYKVPTQLKRFFVSCY